MGKRFVLSITLVASSMLVAQAVRAQGFDPWKPIPPAAPAAPQVPPVRTPLSQIDALTQPIAGYPDGVIVNILAGAAYPQEILAAAQWQRANPNPDELTMSQLIWQAPVIALVRSPTVLQQMAGNIAWTQALGAANLAQHAAVLDSIQRWRAAAN